MSAAQQRLSEGVTLSAQRQQQAVLARLDQIIADAKKQQQQQQQQSSQSAQAQPQQQQQPSSQNQPGQQQQPSASQQQQQPTQGNQGDQTQARAGQAEESDPINADAPLEELRAGWGQLPPRVRDALLQGKDQRLSAVYRRMTEAYFERLAELATEGNP